MTSEELDELEKLEKAATPGPWVYEHSPGDTEYALPDSFDVIAPNGDALCAMYTSDVVLSETHGQLIPAIRNAAPALIAAARENARMRAVVEAARDVHRAFFVNTDGELRFVSLESATATVCRLDNALSALDAKGVE
jgi:hypothetical protein